MSVLEGDAGTTDLVFAVSLSHPSSAPVSVTYDTQDGTAVAGSDYTATSGTLSFAAHEVSKQVTVKALGDTANEGNESLTLELSNPSGATLADASGLGVIQNDDFKYARPKAATQIAAQLVQAYDACVAPNREHAAPWTTGSCAPPVQSSGNLTSGTPDANCRPRTSSAR